MDWEKIKYMPADVTVTRVFGLRNRYHWYTASRTAREFCSGDGHDGLLRNDGIVHSGCWNEASGVKYVVMTCSTSCGVPWQRRVMMGTISLTGSSIVVLC